MTQQRRKWFLFGLTGRGKAGRTTATGRKSVKHPSDVLRRGRRMKTPGCIFELYENTDPMTVLRRVLLDYEDPERPTGRRNKRHRPQRYGSTTVVNAASR